MVAHLDYKPTMALAQTNAARRLASSTATDTVRRKARGRGLVFQRKVVATPSAGRPPAFARVGEVTFSVRRRESTPCFAFHGVSAPPLLYGQVACGAKSRPESFGYAQDAHAGGPRWVWAEVG